MTSNFNAVRGAGKRRNRQRWIEGVLGARDITDVEANALKQKSPRPDAETLELYRWGITKFYQEPPNDSMLAFDCGGACDDGTRFKIGVGREQCRALAKIVLLDEQDGCLSALVEYVDQREYTVDEVQPRMLRQLLHHRLLCGLFGTEKFDPAAGALLTNTEIGEIVHGLWPEVEALADVLGVVRPKLNGEPGRRRTATEMVQDELGDVGLRLTATAKSGRLRTYAIDIPAWRWAEPHYEDVRGEGEMTRWVHLPRRAPGVLRG